jgi:hypothetical protein
VAGKRRSPVLNECPASKVGGKVGKMGKFADAVRSHKKHLYLYRHGYDTKTRNIAYAELAKDLEVMLDTIFDEFDQDDQKEWKWVEENEPD